jgi:hypothetical protein
MGNYQVRFLGGKRTEMSLPYPVIKIMNQNHTGLFLTKIVELEINISSSFLLRLQKLLFCNNEAIKDIYKKVPTKIIAKIEEYNGKRHYKKAKIWVQNEYYQRYYEIENIGYLIDRKNTLYLDSLCKVPNNESNQHIIPEDYYLELAFSNETNTFVFYLHGGKYNIESKEIHRIKENVIPEAILFELEITEGESLKKYSFKNTGLLSPFLDNNYYYETDYFKRYSNIEKSGNDVYWDLKTYVFE